MKRFFYSLVLALWLIIPASLMAQDAQPVKGKRGGTIITGENNMHFEAVSKSNGYAFYPCTAAGEMLNVVPTSVDITFVTMDAKVHSTVKDVPIQNGCFSVTDPNADYPVYMYVVSYNHNGQQGVVKYRVPGRTAR